ncbi:MAG TPA: zinc-binding dehydrogenase, partial [Micromonospora sp.]
PAPEVLVASFAPGAVGAVPDPAAGPATGSVPDPATGHTAHGVPDPRTVHDAVHRALALVRERLADGSPETSRLVVVTRGAVATGTAPDVADLVHAPLWGLLRSARTENPGRFVLVDADDSSVGLLPAALATGEPELVLREGVAYVPRLVTLPAGDTLTPPPGETAWRLAVGSPDGTAVDDLALVPAPEATAPLEPGQVRVAVYAAGVNFRDVLIPLGLYPQRSLLGGEGAGVVLEVGPGVTGLVPGDRVMGLFAECGAFGPVAVTDHRVLVPIPTGWSFTQAATVPVTFLTAYQGLVDLANLRPGESVLVHAAAGGVGMAAVQIARHLGALVYATASPGKWDAVRRTGIPEDRIASSRTLDFEERFLTATRGAGVDVVLNSLSRDFVDASLRLLPRGGRFLEMGKTDLRDPDGVAADHPGVAYRAFDLNEAGPERLGQMLRELRVLFECGILTPLPVSRFDVRRARVAFRHLSQARHVGKVVLTVPPFDPDGTVLVTGATGTLGAL